MKKLSGGMLAVIIVVIVAVVVGGVCIGSYNSLVGVQTAVEMQSSTIDAQLQRRNDLIPNLVNTVKGYAQHETEVMTAISDARSRLMAAGTMADKAEADAALTGALGRLLTVVESYPDLKADAQYTALMDELAGTENRIAVARMDYNKAAQEYNQKIRSFPTSLIAGVFGFDKADFFEAAAGAEQAPTVDFSK